MDNNYQNDQENNIPQQPIEAVQPTVQQPIQEPVVEQPVQQPIYNNPVTKAGKSKVGIIIGASLVFVLGVLTFFFLSSGNKDNANEGGESNKTKKSGVYTVYKTGDLILYNPVKNATCEEDTYGCYEWRVITVNDKSSSDKITLQLDHNLLKTDWISSEDYEDDKNYGYFGNTNKGPITVLKALETATASWDDSLKLTYTYDTKLSEYNYGTLSCLSGECKIAENTLTTNLKARIITAEEVTAITKAAGAASGTIADKWTLSSKEEYAFSNSGYKLGTYTILYGEPSNSTGLEWLVENTLYSEASGATTNTYSYMYYQGYWTLSPSTVNRDSVWVVDYSGALKHADVIGGVNGIRPVIEIEKSVIK